MKILVIGDTLHFDECSKRLGDHIYTHLKSHDESEQVLAEQDLIFDFLIASKPEAFQIYINKNVTVFLNTVGTTLMALARTANGPMGCTIFGFNGFPTMFDRDLLEVSLLKADDDLMLKKACQDLKLDYRVVDDRVGMVTPRVICMIINEAYYTVQEGTASREDIDLAMKLGTNYPYGPFEWCERIGLKHVYELLEALQADTRDERYKISALMKKEYLAAPSGT